MTDKGIGASAVIVIIIIALIAVGGYFILSGGEEGGGGQPTDEFGNEFVVNTNTSDFQINPSVAMDGNGNFVIVWSSKYYDGDLYGIFARRFNADGEGLGDEFQINTRTKNNQKDPSVDMNDNGEFVITWESWYQENDNGYDVYARRFNSSEQPLDAEFRVNNYTESYQKDASVAMDAEGNFVVTWLSWGQNGEGNWIYAKHFDSSGSSQDNEFLVSGTPVDYQKIPSLEKAEDLEMESEPEQINIAGDENGNFVIVWVFENEDSRGIRARLYDNTASPKSGIFQVNTEEDVQGEVSVSMNNAGDFIISWMGEGGNGNVLAKVYNRSGEVKLSDFQVSNYPELKQGYPSAGIEEDGSFAIAWETGVSEGGQSQDGDKTGISARRFNAEGIASGDEFQVNQHWRDWQEETGAAIHNGLFVVTWMSTEVDGDADDISARLFNDS